MKFPVPKLLHFTSDSAMAESHNRQFIRRRIHLRLIRRLYNVHTERLRDTEHAGASEFFVINTRLYLKVSGLAAWSENCKSYSSLPLGAVVSLFCETV